MTKELFCVKKFLGEFKDFINRGNVVDMAVGVMIGAAFKSIVDSVVSDLISPLIGLIFKADFNDLKIILRPEVLDLEGAVLEEAVTLNYGAFIMAVLNFFIIAIILFLMVKMINSVRNVGKKEEPVVEAAPTTKVCPFCKSEIAIDATRCAHCTSELKD